MFRFTIRDLIWLTVVVALGVGWALEMRHRGPENFKLRTDNELLRIKLTTDAAQFQKETRNLNGKVNRLNQAMSNLESRSRMRIGWLLKTLDQHGYRVAFNDGTTSATITPPLPLPASQTTPPNPSATAPNPPKN